MKRVVFAGDRLFMKFTKFEYFHERLSALGAEIVRQEDLTEEELTEAMRTADVLAVIAFPVDRNVIEGLERCRLIQTLSVGFDSVDVEAATARGIPVCNTPTYCTNEVATHTITLLLSVGRKIHRAIPRTRAARWGYEFARPIHSVAGLRLGLVGLGRVGRAVVPKAVGLGLEVAAYDPYLDDDIFEAFGVVRCFELSELLETSDYLSLHAPLTGETHHIIDAEAISAMKSGAVLINTARGGLVDTSALTAALESGKLSGAGIDVLENEPPPADAAILACDNALITPHIAWYSEESHRNNQVLAMDEVERVLTGHRPRHIVNPQVLYSPSGSAIS